MQKLKKIDEQTNIITWFEIPVKDLDRAKKFYETILNIEMVKRGDGKDEGVFFPFNPNIVQATSGRVTGVLSKTEDNTPSGNGTVVYINAVQVFKQFWTKSNKQVEKLLPQKC